MIDFEYIVLIRGSVHMSILLYVHQKREAVCALSLPVTGQDSTPLSLILLSIPYILPHTLCVTSHPSLKGGGASDPKNPDPYYYFYTITFTI